MEKAPVRGEFSSSSKLMLKMLSGMVPPSRRGVPGVDAIQLWMPLRRFDTDLH